MLSRICFVCVIGMLEYMLVMSREVNEDVGLMGVRCSLLISSVVFFSMLKECGSGAICVIFDVKSVANLYAGALRQLTMGRMGWSGL